MNKRAELNSADWGRIEAALRSVVTEFAAIPESERHPRALPAMRRTLDKVNRINNSGERDERVREDALREAAQAVEDSGTPTGSYKTTHATAILSLIDGAPQPDPSLNRKVRK